MLSKDLFLFSALSFLIANNLHFVISGSWPAIILDWSGMGLLIYGLYKNFKGKEQ